MAVEQPLRRTKVGSNAEVEALFDGCKQKEKEWLQLQNSQQIARKWLFEEPKFGVPPEADASSPLQWMNLYEDMVEQLRTADDLMLWYWLGQWFKWEGIRDPMKFLPAGIVSQLIQRMNISGADIRNAGIVRIWLPYTEPLVRKTRWLRQKGEGNPSDTLRKLGYDSKALAIVTSKSWNSAIEFTCEWLAHASSRGNIKYPRDSLINSYSRYRERWWLNVTRCAFLCIRRAEGEFWVRGESIPHCPEHPPDKLPISQNDAWLDRTGRLWWREGLEIRSAVPDAPSFLPSPTR